MSDERPGPWETITGYARRSEAGLELFLGGLTADGRKVGGRFRLDWYQLGLEGSYGATLKRMTAELERLGCS